MSSGARCLRGDQSIGARCPGGEVSKLQGGDMSTGAKCLVTLIYSYVVYAYNIFHGTVFYGFHFNGNGFDRVTNT